jgi:hypothetical protein
MDSSRISKTVYIEPEEEDWLVRVSTDFKVPISYLVRVAIGLLREVYSQYYLNPIDKANEILAKSPVVEMNGIMRKTKKKKDSKIQDWVDWNPSGSVPVENPSSLMPKRTVNGSLSP